MKIKLKPFSSRHLYPRVTAYHRQSWSVHMKFSFLDKVRNLVFILDSNLTMKQHVINICQTAYYELKRISSIRRYLTDDAAKHLVTSCVLSRLDYCNSLLMGTPNSVIQLMQKVQNTAARLILRAPRRQNCTPLLQQLHWLPIPKLLACVTVQSQVPLPLNFLSYYTYTVLPALSALCQTHACSNSNASTAEPMAFSHFGPHIWNNFPQDIRHSATLSSFKSQLKTFLFSENFN